jgi:hypothetical protein
MAYVVEPVFPDGDPRNALTTGPAGSPGKYRVNFILGVPGRYVVQDSVDFTAAMSRGDSLLAVSEQVHELRIAFSDAGTAHLEASVHVNEHHRLRDVSIDLDATGFDNAAKLGHDLLIPVISRWSYAHDVAITTSGLLIEELATGTTSMEVTVAGAVKTFSDVEGESNPEHRALLAAYREGLSPFGVRCRFIRSQKVCGRYELSAGRPL